MDEPLVAGRECGSCNVCCVALTIRDTELSKPAGFRCRNTTAEGGCAIYEARPATCRSFFCGWRQLRWVREPLRPDRSGVLVRRHRLVNRETGRVQEGVIVTLLGRHGLRAEGLAETMAAAVAAGLPTFLSVQGPPGHTSATARVNDALEEVVRFKDKQGLLAILRRAYSTALHGKFAPIDMEAADPTGPGAV